MSRSDMVKIAELPHPVACQITGPPAHKDVLS